MNVSQPVASSPLRVPPDATRRQAPLFAATEDGSPGRLQHLSATYSTRDIVLRNPRGHRSVDESFRRARTLHHRPNRERLQ